MADVQLVQFGQLLQARLHRDDAVALNAEQRQRLQLAQIFQLRDLILAQVQLRQLAQVAQIFNLSNAIGAQLQRVQVDQRVQIFNYLDLIVDQKELA